jgi:hypothetical protein
MRKKTRDQPRDTRAHPRPLNCLSSSIYFTPGAASTVSPAATPMIDHTTVNHSNETSLAVQNNGPLDFIMPHHIKPGTAYHLHLSIGASTLDPALNTSMPTNSSSTAFFADNLMHATQSRSKGNISCVWINSKLASILPNLASDCCIITIQYQLAPLGLVLAPTNG